MREDHKLELYQQMRAENLDAGRMTEGTENTYRSIQGLPLLNPAGSRDDAVLQSTATMALLSGLLFLVVWWFV